MASSSLPPRNSSRVIQVRSPLPPTRMTSPSISPGPNGTITRSPTRGGFTIVVLLTMGGRRRSGVRNARLHGPCRSPVAPPRRTTGVAAIQFRPEINTEQPEVLAERVGGGVSPIQSSTCQVRAAHDDLAGHVARGKCRDDGLG